MIKLQRMKFPKSKILKSGLEDTMLLCTFLLPRDIGSPSHSSLVSVSHTVLKVFRALYGTSVVASALFSFLPHCPWKCILRGG